jgi:hypothetical protein
VAKTTLFGTEVVEDGTRVKWGTLVSIVIGAPVYAYLAGFIDLVQLFGGGVASGVGGIGEFAGELLRLQFVGISDGISSAWWSFQTAVESSFGIFAWPITMLTVVVVAYLLIQAGGYAYGR